MRLFMISPQAPTGIGSCSLYGCVKVANDVPSVLGTVGTQFPRLILVPLRYASVARRIVLPVVAHM